jgi:hypothetical protein
MTDHDLREQLVNERKVGTFAEVQLPLERITTVHGILLDLDPKLYRPGNTLFPPDADPKVFFENVKAVLDRHPLARSAEVRSSGSGLHVIIRLDPPAELTSAADQGHWDNIVRAVQCTLPGDLHAPGLTALTRPAGAVNSKNGAAVEVLRPGQALAPALVEQFLTRVAQAPFKAVATILLGSEHVQPCPICLGEGSRLDVLDHVGMCYGTCGKVKLAQLFDKIYADTGPATEAVVGDMKDDVKPAASAKKEVARKGAKEVKHSERPAGEAEGR